ncbi:MAG: hypothetical protein JWL85_1044 [Candidatus Saccharibacteria bacterium]|nr:hypothetical protein [Candidatus Saccharibacteria bacterium]
MKEKHRTIILLILLAIAVGYIIWMQNSYSSNFTDTL